MTVLLAAPTAQAEGLFDFLFGGSDSDRAAPAGPAPAPGRWQRRGAPRDELGHSQRNAERGQRQGQGQGRRSEARSGERSGDGFCVRTCDGYFFPLIRSSRATGQQSCEFLCPSAPVELYAGSSIETARNAKGQHYGALPAAYSFRDRATEKCACNDPNASASYQQLARTDPTLRSGDIVVEDTGPFVYNGASLVTLGRASVPSQIRERLRAMLKQNAREPASSATAARVSKPAPPVSKPMEAQGSIEFVPPSATP